MFTNPAKNCNKLSTSVLFTSFWGLASPHTNVLQLRSPGWWSVEIFLFPWFCFFYLNLINLIKGSQYPMGWNVRPEILCSELTPHQPAPCGKKCSHFSALLSPANKSLWEACYISCHSAPCDCISIAVGPVCSVGKKCPACLQKPVWSYVHVCLIAQINSVADMKILAQHTGRIYEAVLSLLPLKRNLNMGNFPERRQGQIRVLQLHNDIKQQESHKDLCTGFSVPR